MMKKEKNDFVQDFSSHSPLSLKDIIYCIIILGHNFFFKELKVIMSYNKSSLETYEAWSHNKSILGWCFAGEEEHLKWVRYE